MFLSAIDHEANSATGGYIVRNMMPIPQSSFSTVLIAGVRGIRAYQYYGNGLNTT